jgi:hypothetical protein
MKTIVFVFCVGCAFAQSEDGDKLVTVPKRYLSQEALAHEAPKQVVEASRWVGFGKEVGQAMNEGLSAVVNQADRFGTTRVGTFVMFLVAWKVIGAELVGIVLGIPICIAGVALWIWSMRRFFFGRRVLVKQEDKVREWKLVAYNFSSGDGKVACGIGHFAFLALWLLVWVIKIF